MPNTLLKRGRTPSPPPNQGYYKTNQQYSQGPSIYYLLIKFDKMINGFFFLITELEEGRRGGEVARAVLWNSKLNYKTKKKFKII